MHFDAFERRIHIAHRAAAGAFFAHDMPRLQGVAQREVDSQCLQIAHAWKAEFKVRCKPCGVELKTAVAQLS